MNSFFSFFTTAYPYRGLLLDTSRNFFSVNSILNLITAMSYNKMNTLHWHITDTQSFPIEIPSVPDLHKYGAYSPERIYTQEDVRKIVNYGMYELMKKFMKKLILNLRDL